MEADADAEERPVGRDPIADRADEPAGVEVFHAIAKRADTREDQFVDPVNIVRAGDGLMLHLEGVEGVADGALVTCAVVDDPGDHVS